MIENPDIAGKSNEELASKLEEFIAKLGYNILNKFIDEEKIHYYVQTKEGLEELIIDDTLFTSPHYNEAIYIYQKIKEYMNEELEQRDLLEDLAKIEDHAKKGAYIQRYKGNSR